MVSPSVVHSIKSHVLTTSTSKKKEIAETRDNLAPGDHCYDGDDVNLSLFPPVRKMWLRRGRQVEIPTHGTDQRAYGIGAVNYHTGETVMMTREHKRRVDVADLLRALLAYHATGTMYLAGDNCSTHSDKEIDAMLKEAHGRFV